MCDLKQRKRQLQSKSTEAQENLKKDLNKIIEDAMKAQEKVYVSIKERGRVQ